MSGAIKYEEWDRFCAKPEAQAWQFTIPAYLILTQPFYVVVMPSAESSSTCPTWLSGTRTHAAIGLRLKCTLVFFFQKLDFERWDRKALASTIIACFVIRVAMLAF